MESAEKGYGVIEADMKFWGHVPKVWKGLWGYQLESQVLTWTLKESHRCSSVGILSTSGFSILTNCIIQLWFWLLSVCPF